MNEITSQNDMQIQWSMLYAKFTSVDASLWRPTLPDDWYGEPMWAEDAIANIIRWYRHVVFAPSNNGSR